MAKKEVEDILDKYRKKLGDGKDLEGFSRQYQKFKLERVKKKLSNYEKACNIFGKLIEIKVDAKKRNLLQESIDRVGLNTTPEKANSFAVFVGSLFIFLGLALFILSFVSTC